VTPEERIRLLRQRHDFAGDAYRQFQAEYPPLQEEPVLRRTRPESAPLIPGNAAQRRAIEEARQRLEEARQRLEERENFVQGLHRQSLEEPEMPVEPESEEQALDMARLRTKYERPGPGERYDAPYHRDQTPIRGRVMPSDIRRHLRARRQEEPEQPAGPWEE